MDRRTKIFAEEDEELMSFSLYRPNPVGSSSKMKQQLPLESNKKRTQKKPLGIKSKGKQIMSGKLQKSKSYKRKRTRMCDIYDNVEDQFSVMERAGKFLESLDARLPGFAKCMLPSNVTYSFWLILPKPFCNVHLPKHDSTIILVDECGQEYKTNYLMERHGLSAGWRGFSITHRLLKGDILVFHLVEPCKLKVHIVRLHGIEAVEAAICLMSLDAHVKRMDSGEAKKDKLMNKMARKGKRTLRKAKKFVEIPPLDICPPKVEPEEDGEGVSNTDQFEISSDAFGSDTLEGSATEKTNQLQAKELTCCGSLCYSDHLHKGINCRSTARGLYCSSTLAT